MLPLLAVCMLPRVRAAGPRLLTASNFDGVVGADRHTIVEWFAPWCTACTNFAPALHKAAAELTRARDDVHFVRVDGDAQPDLRVRFQIDEAPSVLLFAAGTPAEPSAAVRYAGPLDGAALLAWARHELDRLPPAPPASPALPPASPPPASPKRAAAAPKQPRDAAKKPGTTKARPAQRSPPPDASTPAPADTTATPAAAAAGAPPVEAAARAAEAAAHADSAARVERLAEELLIALR
eukprot:5599548-Prymnesium_polylepis.1